jgi:Xaa-Pro aminopeptidase
MTQTKTQQIDNQTAAACARRLGDLRSAMENAGVDALIVASEPDIFYLTDFVGHDSLLLVTGEGGIIISDPRYDEFLDPWREVPGLSIHMGVRHRLEQSVADLCAEAGLKKLGIQAEHVTVAARHRLVGALRGLTLADTVGLVGELRKKKDAVEIARIEKAAAIQQAALTAALDKLQAGMTELEFCAELYYQMQIRGSFKPSFDAIIGAGPNSSVIHYMTGQGEIQPGCLLVDWGATYHGYCADLTRTFGIGEMPAKIVEIYAIVLDAQMAAIAACAPGRRCADIDAVARDVITNAGYGEYFGHGLGHGLGIEVHEDPYFNDLSDDILAPGNVMTVEPGIYLPGVGGVRIEDDVLITEDGHRVLSEYPKDLAGATRAI